VSQWLGIVAPAKTPQPVLQRLHEEITRVVRSDDYAKFIRAQGAVPAPMTPEEFTNVIRTDLARWGKLVKATGVTAQ
jgi:tripartite-type tricarboxylate transporter receptor subunit TctC